MKDNTLSKLGRTRSIFTGVTIIVGELMQQPQPSHVGLSTMVHIDLRARGRAAHSLHPLHECIAPVADCC
jgi:hypothetical protein